MLMWLGAANNASQRLRAVALLQKALRLDGSLAEPHYQLGKLAVREGKMPEALQEFETARRLEPGSSKTRYELALVYRKLGRIGDANRELEIYRKLKATKDNQTPGGRESGVSVPMPPPSPSASPGL